MAEAYDSFPQKVEEGRSASGTQKVQGLSRLLRKGKGAHGNLTVPVLQKAAKGESHEPGLPRPAWETHQDEKEWKYFLSSVMGRPTWIY